MVGKGAIREAYLAYIAPELVHHNPHFTAGAKGLEEGMIHVHKQYPQKKMTIKHVIGEGDIVMVHSHVILKPTLEIAVVHIHRYEKGKIVEMWDVGQTIPAYVMNKDGMF